MDQASHLRNIIKNSQVNKQVSRARVITVTSGKGGVGKSNVSVNLAINLRRQGKRVVIFDADFGLANIEVIFGIVPKFNLFDMIYKNMEITEIITTGPHGVEFISGGNGVSDMMQLEKAQIDYMVRMLYKLDCMADVIIIDTGAGISDSVMDFINASDEMLLVTTPEPTAVTDAYAVIKSMKKRRMDMSDRQINLLVNKVSNEKEANEVYNKLNKVCKRFLNVELNNIGSLPYDKTLEKSVIEQKPVSMLYPKSRISKGFEQLTDNILSIEGESKSDAGKQTGLSALFSQIMRKKGK